jgi:hypothetical protein
MPPESRRVSFREVRTKRVVEKTRAKRAFQAGIVGFIKPKDCGLAPEMLMPTRSLESRGYRPLETLTRASEVSVAFPHGFHAATRTRTLI